VILERHLVTQSHTHRFVVTDDAAGWDVREEEDAVTIRHAHHTDWHRVERAVQRFEWLAAEAFNEDGVNAPN
jgi:hypothetical protein